MVPLRGRKEASAVCRIQRRAQLPSYNRAARPQHIFHGAEEGIIIKSGGHLFEHGSVFDGIGASGLLLSNHAHRNLCDTSLRTAALRARAATAWDARGSVISSF